MKCRAVLALVMSMVIMVTVCVALIRPKDISVGTAASSTVITTVTGAPDTSQPSQTAAPTTTVTTTRPPMPSSTVSIHAGLYRADTLQCIYQQDAEERIYPASLTKFTTAYTALQYMSADDVCTVGSELSLVHTGSSLCHIQRGYRIKLQHLLVGLLISSGNDAAYTIAVNVARKVGGEHLTDEQAVTYFCELMNKTAQTLGMPNG